jgi:hypothetical protein
VPTLQQTRRHARWIIALLLVLTALTAVGLACACMSDHPMQGIERVVTASLTTAGFVTPPATSVWPLAFAVVVAGVLLLPHIRFGYGRGSPPVLQRFRL